MTLMSGPRVVSAHLANANSGTTVQQGRYALWKQLPWEFLGLVSAVPKERCRCAMPHGVRWHGTAQVCTETGKTAEGIQGQKRLILDHAAKMYMDLNSKKLTLETGYSLEGASEVVPCKVTQTSPCTGIS